jgi:hypothetical protein
MGSTPGACTFSYIVAGTCKSAIHFVPSLCPKMARARFRTARLDLVFQRLAGLLAPAVLKFTRILPTIPGVVVALDLRRDRFAFHREHSRQDYRQHLSRADRR